MKASVLLGIINDYKEKLEKSTRWHGSKESIAPIIEKDSKKDKNKEDSYVYEFYCYLSLINDLRTNYQIKFIEGKEKYKYRFPQAASNKSGKPKFEAYEDGKLAFQICAGTRVIGISDSEDVNPDISFQLPNAGDNPTKDDLIIIFDAKYQDDFRSRLKAKEFQSFSYVVKIFYELPSPPKLTINFKAFHEFHGNCLITNVQAHNKSDKMMKIANVKEIVEFFPGKKHKVWGI